MQHSCVCSRICQKMHQGTTLQLVLQLIFQFSTVPRPPPNYSVVIIVDGLGHTTTHSQTAIPVLQVVNSRFCEKMHHRVTLQLVLQLISQTKMIQGTTLQLNLQLNSETNAPRENLKKETPPPAYMSMLCYGYGYASQSYLEHFRIKID